MNKSQATSHLNNNALDLISGGGVPTNPIFSNCTCTNNNTPYSMPTKTVEITNLDGTKKKVEFFEEWAG